MCDRLLVCSCTESEVSDSESTIYMSYDELEEALEELHENFQKLMSRYNALKKRHSNLPLSYDKLELDNKDNISEIKNLKEKINHITIENRTHKERHIPPVLSGKPPTISKIVFNHKKPFMHARSIVNKNVCHA